MSFETNVFDLVSVRASQALKNLLENKHLYQKVEITTIDIVEAEAKKEAHPMLATKHRYWGTNELPKKSLHWSNRKPLGLKSLSFVQCKRHT